VILLKATISFVTSIGTTDRTESLGYHWNDFHYISYLRIFLKQKSVENIQVSVNCDKN